MTLSATISKEEWLEIMRPLDGQLVQVVGCATLMTAIRSWSEGFLLWPQEHCPGASAGDSFWGPAGKPPDSREISVRYARSAKPIPDAARPYPLVRVTGRLRLGDVATSGQKIVYSWGDIEDAHAELVR